MIAKSFLKAIYKKAGFRQNNLLYLHSKKWKFWLKLKVSRVLFIDINQ